MLGKERQMITLGEENELGDSIFVEIAVG